MRYLSLDRNDPTPYPQAWEREPAREICAQKGMATEQVVASFHGILVNVKRMS